MTAMTMIDVLVNPLVAALLAYAVLLGVLIVVARPMRLEMVVIAEQMLAERTWTKHQRDEINNLLDTCLSLKRGGLIPVAVVKVTLQAVQGKLPTRERWATELFNDPRFDQLLDRYTLSLLAANPIAGLVSLPLMVVGFLVLTYGQNREGHQIVDRPAFMVASGAAGMVPTS